MSSLDYFTLSLLNFQEESGVRHPTLHLFFDIFAYFIINKKAERAPDPIFAHFILDFFHFLVVIY